MLRAILELSPPQTTDLSQETKTEVLNHKEAGEESEISKE